VTLAERVPASALRLQASEVADARWVRAGELEARYRRADPTLVPIAADSEARCARGVQLRLVVSHYNNCLIHRFLNSPVQNGMGRASEYG
jgi:hypothetical protein